MEHPTKSQQLCSTSYKYNSVDMKGQLRSIKFAELAVQGRDTVKLSRKRTTPLNISSTV